MENKRNAFDAGFKLNAIDLAVTEGNRVAAHKLDINESMVRRWRWRRDELSKFRKTTKAFQGKKYQWPELKKVLEDLVNTQRAGGRGVSTVQILLKAITITTEIKLKVLATDHRGVSDL